MAKKAIFGVFGAIALSLGIWSCSKNEDVKKKETTFYSAESRNNYSINSYNSASKERVEIDDTTYCIDDSGFTSKYENGVLVKQISLENKHNLQTREERGDLYIVYGENEIQITNIKEYGDYYSFDLIYGVRKIEGVKFYFDPNHYQESSMVIKGGVIGVFRRIVGAVLGKMVETLASTVADRLLGNGPSGNCNERECPKGTVPRISYYENGNCKTFECVIPR